MNFTSKIVNWYTENKRSLPWRNTNDPYKIWLSEIILQQTQIAQGLPYYINFVNEYPDVIKLAQASEQEVLKLWEGLGYYSRARNLHKAAKIVVNDFKGVFPSNYSELIKLPGIGDYTASAVSSFSVNAINPVVDGNVYRFLSRLIGVNTAINTNKSQKEFRSIAQKLISKKNPSDFNQARRDCKVVGGWVPPPTPATGGAVRHGWEARRRRFPVGPILCPAATGSRPP